MALSPVHKRLFAGVKPVRKKTRPNKKRAVQQNNARKKVALPYTKDNTTFHYLVYQGPGIRMPLVQRA